MSRQVTGHASAARLAVATLRGPFATAGWRLIGLVVGLGVLAAVPHVATPYVTALLLFGYLYIALASSWNIISGYTGYVSFGHVAFFGIGSYTSAILMTKAGWGFLAGSLMGGVLSTAVAVVIGFACLRLKGPYFAIAMLGLAETIRVIVTVWESLTNGGTGISIPPAESPLPAYYAMGATALATVLTSYAIANSKFGLRLMAIREDEIAAEAMGINTTRYKLLAFMASAFFPGVVGGINSYRLSFIEPVSTFIVLETLYMVIMTLFGGRGTVAGPVLGAVVLYLFQEWVWVRFPFWHLFAYGSLIIIITLFMPRGIMGILIDRGLIAKGVFR